MVLGIGSIGLGIGATNTVLSASQTFGVNGGSSNSISGAQVALVALIWIIIGVINVAYARRR
jgi:hypothetical protein